METVDDFMKRVRRASEHRVYRIRNSYGVYDAYKWYRRHRPDEHRYVLTESQYFSIVRNINNILAGMIVSGEDVRLPCRMGSIQLRKFDRRVGVRPDGSVTTNLPVDWDSTLRMWYDDREAYDKRILIRLDERELFKICYIKGDANYTNRTFYDIVFNKGMKTELKKNIKAGGIDAFAMRRRSR